jgi:hypothetical protein
MNNNKHCPLPVAANGLSAVQATSGSGETIPCRRRYARTDDAIADRRKKETKSKQQQSTERVLKTKRLKRL